MTRPRVYGPSKGKWVIEDEGNHPVAITARDEIICLWPEGYDLPEPEICWANARLMAAAPEMHKELDAIAVAIESNETVTIEPGSLKAERIKAAIAKAKGE